MGEIHELFVLPLSLVWFAGATPEFRTRVSLFKARVFAHLRPPFRGLFFFWCAPPRQIQPPSERGGGGETSVYHGPRNYYVNNLQGNKSCNCNCNLAAKVNL